MHKLVRDGVQEMRAAEKARVHGAQPVVAPIVILKVAVVAGGHEACGVARDKVLVFLGVDDAHRDRERRGKILCGKGKKRSASALKIAKAYGFG